MLMSLQSDRQLLDTYSCIEPKVPQTPADAEELRGAILRITQAAESENLGICADTCEQAYQALAQYLKALDYPIPEAPDPTAPTDEPVYLKFNATTLKHFAKAYSGDYRGVLIACQAEEDVVNGTFGHFPLDLFSEM
ncbi:MAG: DUF1824 family protein [Spirulina sp. SIO3F2]|nr:DUF1824 family protein [Spirulina sp. SIO3F2]